MKKIIYISILLLLSISTCLAQNLSHRISLNTGYGLAGSFFVRSVVEVPPIPTSDYRQFAKKHFIGNAQNFAIGIYLSKKYELKAGINYQHFTRRVKANDTLASIIIYLDNTIHHRDYIYFASVQRLFTKPKHIISCGLGIYYLRVQQENIEYGRGIPDFYSNFEANFQNANAEEGGILTDIAYEYKFQPRVNLGIKAQFYYTVSASSAESITLFPFIKLNF